MPLIPNAMIWLEQVHVFSKENVLLFIALGAALMIANSLLMTPPSEYICITWGMLLADHLFETAMFIALATVCNLLGTMPYYVLGIYHSSATRSIYGRCSYKSKFICYLYRAYTGALPRIEELFRRDGVRLLFLLRNVPVLRSIVSYPAGRVQMPLLAFLVTSLCGMFVWVVLWTVLGAILGEIALKYKIPIAFVIGTGCLLLMKFLLKRARRCLLGDGHAS